MTHSFIERRRIHRQAKAKLGLKTKDAASDRFAFMSQCVSALVDEGIADDESEAEQICELLYDEEADSDVLFDQEL